MANFCLHKFEYIVQVSLINYSYPAHKNAPTCAYMIVRKTKIAESLQASRHGKLTDWPRVLLDADRQYRD